MAAVIASPDYSQRGLNPDRLRAIEQFAHGDVLDVGCGAGAYVLHFAASKRIRGVDYQRFDAWSRRPELFDVADAGRLPAPDGSVDTVLSFETLEHLPDPEQALREFYRVCRRRLIITVPNCRLTTGMQTSGVIYNHWIDRTHVNFWDLDSITHLVQRSGFSVVHSQHINQINLGPLFAESWGLRGFAARATAGLFRRLQFRKYFMTCMVVADRNADGRGVELQR